ncbi:MAG: hypothetical protein H0W82_07480 [Actinobacteria bacterium]|nr:hypothetical protein [Actinomycetota bacterium]
MTDNDPTRVAIHVHRDFDVLIVRIGEDPTEEDLRRALEECLSQVDGGAERIVVAGKGMRRPSGAIEAFLRKLHAAVEPGGVTVRVPAPGEP